MKINSLTPDTFSPFASVLGEGAPHRFSPVAGKETVHTLWVKRIPGESFAQFLSSIEEPKDEEITPLEIGSTEKRFLSSLFSAMNKAAKGVSDDSVAGAFRLTCSGKGVSWALNARLPKADETDEEI